MNKFQKWQLILKIWLIIAIVGGITLGIVTGDAQDEKADTVYERIFKTTAFFLVMLALVMYWVLPNTKLAKRLKMNESLFVISHILGMICGVIGLVATIFWQQMIVETHLFEFLVIFFGLIYVYWFIVLKAKRTSESSGVLDEKQIENITKSGAATLYLVTCVLLLMYFASYHRVFALEGKTWFLFYFFMTLLIYSANTLYYFKKT